MKDIFSLEFKKYGRVITEYDFGPLLELLDQIPMPESVEYRPSVVQFEQLPLFQELQSDFAAGMPLEIGYCNGYNLLATGFEYHRCSEITACGTDVIFVLGLRQDIRDDWRYDLSKAEVFFCPKGCAVEFYTSTLHFTPIQNTSGGFRTAVVLSKGTNTPYHVPHMSGERKLIYGRNKFVLAAAGTAQAAKGAWVAMPCAYRYCGDGKLCPIQEPI